MVAGLLLEAAFLPLDLAPAVFRELDFEVVAFRELDFGVVAFRELDFAAVVFRGLDLAFADELFPFVVERARGVVPVALLPLALARLREPELLERFAALCFVCAIAVAPQAGNGYVSDRCPCREAANERRSSRPRPAA